VTAVTAAQAATATLAAAPAAKKAAARVVAARAATTGPPRRRARRTAREDVRDGQRAGSGLLAACAMTKQESASCLQLAPAGLSRSSARRAGASGALARAARSPSRTAGKRQACAQRWTLVGSCAGHLCAARQAPKGRRRGRRPARRPASRQHSRRGRACSSFVQLLRRLREKRSASESITAGKKHSSRDGMLRQAATTRRVPGRRGATGRKT